MKTGINNLVDAMGDEAHKVENFLQDKYLGDIISVDGKNTKNIAAKVSKAIGIVKKVRDTLDDMCLGPYFFEVAVTFRNSLFLNGILTNLEARYGLKEDEVSELEKMDESLLRAILECPRSVPKEVLYLEVGVTPLRYILMSRRLIFYQYIVKEPPQSLIRRFYETQSEKPTKNDWCQTVKCNLVTLNVSSSEHDIRKMSKFVFKKKINHAIRQEAYNYLQKIKSTHSKVLHIQYNRLEMQSYFLSQKMPILMAKFTFLCRTRMLQVGANFKGGNNFPVCPLCEISYDNQSHLLVRQKLTDKEICKQVPKYEDIFSNNVVKMLSVVTNMNLRFKKRQKLLSKTQKVTRY